ncbi:MAG: response regulator [SAR324 cluster bacterium]|nr:response regulator [SAR324 cluster bacterium]
MKILVIEDNLPTLTLLGNILDEYGAVTACSDGEHGVVEYKSAAETSEPFDIIFLDVVLPGIQGDEVVKLIRNDEKTSPSRSKVYIVILSNKVAFHDTGTGMYEGGDIYMPKPFTKSNIDEIMETVNPKAEEDLKKKPTKSTQSK